MNKNIKLLGIIIISFIIVILAMGIGSVYIAPIESINIIIYKIFGYSFLGEVDEKYISILWKIRFPRVILAFISGSGLGISGVIMQSTLKNPMASSYTLGVSSGAALGASLCILLNISIFGIFTMQIFGFLAGLLTVFLALGIASKIDKNMQNNSIILMGMAFSLFANAMLAIIMGFLREGVQSIINWQMGSFASKDLSYILILIPIVIIIFIFVFRFYREMDIMTFGDEQAKISGVSVKNTKWILLSFSAILTGVIVSVSGVIGFVDLFVPHIARRIFGSNHKYVLPATAILAGAFMVLCDLIARTIIAPIEISVGAVTSAIGAPFFVYLYFSKRKKNL
ncbi:MAG: iron ABC transporter permease [Eubacteriales bacterium]|nr:iron ABC transporter permease [Eubacteriales bacterium]